VTGPALRRAALLVGLGLGLHAVDARADDTHYHDFPVGGRAAGLGGAFTAIASDTSGMFYNPAGIVDSTRSSVSLSANLYGIEMAVGDDIFQTVGARIADIKTVFTDLRIVPSAAGFVSTFGEPDAQGRKRHAYGLGAFVPSYRTSNIQTSVVTPERGERLSYQRALVDFEFHTAASYAYRLDDTWRVGLSAIFAYRQVRDDEQTAIFGGPGTSDSVTPFNTSRVTLGAFSGTLAFAFGIKANLDDRWTIGGNLTSPSLAVYDSATLQVLRSSASADGATAFELDEPKRVSAQQRSAGHLRVGIAHVVPGLATFSADLSLHPPVRYKLVEVEDGRPGLEDVITIATDIERRFVANLNLGVEVLVADKKSLALGFFTNYSSAPPIPGDDGARFSEDRLPFVHGYGATAVFGWFAEHTLSRAGVVAQYGRGEDVIPFNQELQPLGVESEFQKIRVKSLFVYVFISSAFRY
jgi:hypothetical protein